MAKVLIIDDSPSEIIRFTSMLSPRGYIIQSVNSGEEGIVNAKKLLPDLILMDVVMGGMNGFQATRHIKQDPATASIPIIMVTTKDQLTDRVWAERQGAAGYLTKPVDESKLLDLIQELLS